MNKCNGGFVDIGETLIYKIIIKNNGDIDYNDDLMITENLSNHVTYEARYETKKNVEFKYDINNRKLIWNIGKLKSGEEVIVYYYVKVTNGNPGDIIENPGFVGNIPSSKVVNTIGKNLDSKKKELIEKKFDKLKKKYNGKKLINEIYKQLFDIDMKFDEFDIKKLVIHKEGLPKEQTIYLNNNHTLYGAILNNYWNALMTYKSAFFEGGEELNFFKLFEFTKPERQRFIYSGNFRTGDILIYINSIDQTYSLDENQNVVKHDITYERGEYSYIYIEGKGFVGINKGNDPNNSKDDRNEFNAKYYKDNKLELFYQGKPTNLSDEFLEMANLQTLFGKDYYVILRPSIIFDFKYKNSSWAIIVVVIIILLILLLASSLIILKKRRNNSKTNKNEVLLSKELNY